MIYTIENKKKGSFKATLPLTFFLITMRMYSYEYKLTYNFIFIKCNSFYSLFLGEIMGVKKSLSGSQLWELRDHRDNTMGDYIKVYTRAQLSYMDGVAEDTVPRSRKYLPVRVDSGPAMDRYRRGTQRKPYRIMYIRLDEIRELYKKRGKGRYELVIELK